ncbi:methyltransferase [Prochlorococcus sp. MIT 0916]|uniref:methyltransferase n=1 Tax=Prochlorococcus sp. MIT 0916 TaxID=3082521 RepID=UPI0039B4A39D
MEGSIQRHKKYTQVTTFPVPFALEESPRNITIGNQPTTKSAQEQLMNQAFKLESQGNIIEAAKYYQQFIDKGFKDHIVCAKYGLILRNLGKLRKAEETTLNAIQINPNYAFAHASLGSILGYRGKTEAAFDSYLKALEINPKLPNIYIYISRFLRDSDPSKLNKFKLKNIFNVLLENTDIIHQELFNIFNFLYGNEIKNYLYKLDSESDLNELFHFFEDNKVIFKALKLIFITDFILEKSLKKIRRRICEEIISNIEDINQITLEITIALAEQCFLNEYVYSSTKLEDIYINQIINRCKNGEMKEIYISIIACYLPLHKLLKQIQYLQDYRPSNNSLKELIKIQILEPLKEIELSKNLKKLGSINEPISKKVQLQYEDNPYPRWKQGFSLKNFNYSHVKSINSEIRPNSINSNSEPDKLKVLIAGCGTGMQITHALIYKDAEIKGIDLSSASLSFAQRKINEMGINNVDLIQMDLLDVGLLKEEFDIILCSGVLHHMKNPLNGLKVLLDTLKENGFLKLGLYSELARENIIKAKSYISKKNLQPNNNDIKLFREDVISGNFPGIDILKSSADFYTLSTCRDLFFHAQEHRFTIKQLQELIRSHQLQFHGFLLPNPVKSLYKYYYPEDKKQTNLQNWEKFEEKHTNTFQAMYQFWVSKRRSN